MIQSTNVPIALGQSKKVQRHCGTEEDPLFGEATLLRVLWSCARGVTERHAETARTPYNLEVTQCFREGRARQHWSHEQAMPVEFEFSLSQQ